MEAQETNDPLADLIGPAWLHALADRLGRDLFDEIEELEAWHWTPEEIAVSMIDQAQQNGITREAMLKARLWPNEKALLLEAAAGEKLEDWTRKALLKAAMLAIANRDRSQERV